MYECDQNYIHFYSFILAVIERARGDFANERPETTIPGAYQTRTTKDLFSIGSETNSRFESEAPAAESYSNINSIIPAFFAKGNAAAPTPRLNSIIGESVDDAPSAIFGKSNAAVSALGHSASGTMATRAPAVIVKSFIHPDTQILGELTPTESPITENDFTESVVPAKPRPRSMNRTSTSIYPLPKRQFSIAVTNSERTYSLPRSRTVLSNMSSAPSSDNSNPSEDKFLSMSTHFHGGRSASNMAALEVKTPQVVDKSPPLTVVDRKALLRRATHVGFGEKALVQRQVARELDIDEVKEVHAEGDKVAALDDDK
ncbi:hypothetical protein HDU97_007933 [Phlyctochytrium planicorne]|nr:hypothetical protein HDU97_007933 [Phlyctochytrium planicorne]